MEIERIKAIRLIRRELEIMSSSRRLLLLLRIYDGMSDEDIACLAEVDTDLFQQGIDRSIEKIYRQLSAVDCYYTKKEIERMIKSEFERMIYKTHVSRAGNRRIQRGIYEWIDSNINDC